MNIESTLVQNRQIQKIGNVVELVHQDNQILVVSF